MSTPLQIPTPAQQACLLDGHSPPRQRFQVLDDGDPEYKNFRSYPSSVNESSPYHCNTPGLGFLLSTPTRQWPLASGSAISKSPIRLPPHPTTNILTLHLILMTLKWCKPSAKLWMSGINQFKIRCSKFVASCVIELKIFSIIWRTNRIQPTRIECFGFTSEMPRLVTNILY